MNFEGILIGFGAFSIIGLLHPVVIKVEYHFGTKAWPLFCLSGAACIVGALFCRNSIITSLLSILGFSLLWSILELFHQQKRVEKGWFPANPRKNEESQGK